MPRHVAGPEGGGNAKRAGGRGLGGRDGGREDARGRSLRRVPPGLVGLTMPSARMLSAERVGAVRRSALRGADLRGKGDVTTDAAKPEELAGVGGRRAAPRATSARRRWGRVHQQLGGGVAVHDAARACAGRNSSAQHSEADLRGELAIHTAAEVTDELVVIHGGSDDGGAPGGCAWCGSCSGATTKARRRGGACVSELGEARRPRPGRSLCGWAGGLPSQEAGRWSLRGWVLRALDSLLGLFPHTIWASWTAGRCLPILASSLSLPLAWK
jgi:hypothetical protein